MALSFKTSGPIRSSGTPCASFKRQICEARMRQRPAFEDRAVPPMAVVDPEYDLGDHPDEQLDSWFITGVFADARRQYGYHLHCLRTNEQARPLVATTASITDLTDGDFYSASADDLGQPARLGASELLIETPLLTLRGDPLRIQTCARFDGC